ncbi:hypothetical protein F4806DRAFT_498211 [Annulohypoxylon nitens]|nr:hypothetical protein F4806DRAFT_498211 [Annulohypoxylon nitens]
MDQPASQPSRGRQWANSKLRSRLPLSEEQCSGNDEVSLHVDSDLKDESSVENSPITFSQSRPGSTRPGSMSAQTATLQQNFEHVPRISSTNAGEAVGDSGAYAGANTAVGTGVNAHTVRSQIPQGNSMPTLRAHTPHKSMDMAFTLGNNPAQPSGVGTARLPGPNSPAHSVHKSADFAINGIRKGHDHAALTYAYQGHVSHVSQAFSNVGHGTAPRAINTGLGDNATLGHATPKSHIRQKASKHNVDSPEISAMLLSKLADSARGKPINSTTSTPDFDKEVNKSLGVGQSSPRKRSPLRTVTNTDDDANERGVSSTQDQTSLLTLRNRTNTIPTFNGRQGHIRTQSLAVEGSSGRTDNSLILRDSEGVDVGTYTQRLPGSVSLGALREHQAGTLVQLSGLGARSTSLDHFQGSSASSVGHQASNVHYVGPLEFLPVPAEIRENRSTTLNQLTGLNGRPSVRDISHPFYVPFTEKLRNLKQSNAAVICITNIPYAVSRAEIFAFLGRAAKSLNDRDEPVHIIMDRMTCKTIECFVEFTTFDEAVQIVSKHQNGLENGTHVPKIGNRDVELTISSQANLMKRLFPQAKGVRWQESPFQITRDSPIQWENYQGFVTQEELTMLCKHVEGYNSPAFAKQCPERAYECMISTIKKFPWNMSEYITVKERDMLCDAGLRMVCRLQKQLSKGEKPSRLTRHLLNRLAEAIISSPGFSITQKDNVAYKANVSEQRLRELGQPRFPELWGHLQAISVKDGAAPDVLEYYIAMIREETNRNAELQGIHSQQHLLDEQATTSDYFGFF